MRLTKKKDFSTLEGKPAEMIADNTAFFMLKSLTANSAESYTRDLFRFFLRAATGKAKLEDAVAKLTGSKDTPLDLPALVEPFTQSAKGGKLFSNLKDLTLANIALRQKHEGSKMTTRQWTKLASQENIPHIARVNRTLTEDFRMDPEFAEYLVPNRFVKEMGAILPTTGILTPPNRAKIEARQERNDLQMKLNRM